MYSKISDGLIKKKHLKNSQQCRSKMEKLIAAYRHTLDHNRGTGNDPKTCSYYIVGYNYVDLWIYILKLIYK